jgi:HD-GYP domain-containing protein (c-di-GMP phosphodiesterase class II)
VSRLAVAIATELKLPAAEHRCVELGALLHDVGKLSIPDRVLTKPAPLNELEWEAMRRHAAHGERLLARIVQQADVLAVVRSHHERWDGRGYPDGKRGEEIPLAARIVAVADAFQAMIEPRPYREPRTRASALDEIASESGRQFDPNCVDALRTVLS